VTNEEALGAAADAALATTEHRLQVEAMQKTNDAALQRIAQLHQIGIQRADIVSVRLEVLVGALFGDMDDERRLTYEHAVQAKFAEVIAEVEQQAMRAKLLNGVRLDPPKNGGRG
jgi:hypothetical protein